MKVNLKETSTLRGIVYIITFLVGLGMIGFGYGDVEKLLLLAGGVAGGLGLLPDKLPK